MARKRGPALNLRQFVAKIDGSKKLFDNAMTRVLHRVAFDAAENVIVGGMYAPGTPVDTGFARASWYVEINNRQGGGDQASYGRHLAHDRSGSQALGAGLSVVGAAKVGDVIWLLNNVPYIVHLEYGSSDQAPRGMVRLTLSAAQQMLDAAIAKEQQ